MFIFILVLACLTSCTTYLIPVESFKAQFAGIDSTKLQNVVVRGPLRETYRYLANPITVIKCEDSKGLNYALNNGPSIEIRFTHGKKNERTTFYFDRVCLNDSCVVGARSRFFPSMIETIPLNSITKIEVQDGRKKFQYMR